MENILSLHRLINKIGWLPCDSCVFYNFAWSRRSEFTENFQDPFTNAIYS